MLRPDDLAVLVKVAALRGSVAENPKSVEAVSLLPEIEEIALPAVLHLHCNDDRPSLVVKLRGRSGPSDKDRSWPRSRRSASSYASYVAQPKPPFIR